MHITVLPALRDNYIYIIRHDDRLAVIDPGEAAPVLGAAGGVVEAIILTHHHSDHIGGVAELRRAYPEAAVYAPAECGIDRATVCGDGDEAALFDGAARLRAVATPGHCGGHLSWLGDGVLFSGDALFLGGCGRILGGGSAAELYESLRRLARLPDETRIYCGHEYTAGNLAFAQAAEPENPAIARRREILGRALAGGQASVPGNIISEKRTNPFLRADTPAVVASASAWAGCALDPGYETFAALRKWKDNF